MLYGGGNAVSATLLIDAETPSGTINGINNNFTLGHIPAPVGSLELYRNGLLQQSGGFDYSLIGNLITFQALSNPQAGDSLFAFYRSTNTSTINAVFTGQEIPAGLINGVNLVYTLVNVPNPGASLKLFKNGVLMIAGGVDYTLVGNTITYVAGQVLGVNDTHICDYRQSTGVFVNPQFVDAETPAGVKNGVNTIFTLLFNPNPASSLDLYKNGDYMIAGGVDYTLVNNTITYVAGVQPAAADTHIAFYRR